jgi:hypothetical protein
VVTRVRNKKRKNLRSGCNEKWVEKKNQKKPPLKGGLIKTENLIPA